MSGLRRIRQEHKLSQKELALVTGLTAASISRYETGGRRMSVDVAKRISKALNVNWVSLFADQKAMKDL